MSDPINDPATDERICSGGDNENTNSTTAQSPDPISGTANTQVNWHGDPRYFQSGDKAGTLKPAHRDSAPREMTSTTAKPFDNTASVSKQARTDGATMPARAVKTKAMPKGKTATKAADGVPDHVTAAAMYNMLLVASCRIISDEYEQTPEVEKATIKAACEYFETTGITLPPWVGLLGVTALNLGAAFKTPKGKSRLAHGWDNVKAWWLTRGKHHG